MCVVWYLCVTVCDVYVSVVYLCAVCIPVCYVLCICVLCVIFMYVVLRLCVCYLCVLFKVSICYWHSRDSHSTAIPAMCTRTCVRPSGLFFLHQHKSMLHPFPALPTGQLFNTTYLFSAKTLFFYEFTLTFCLNPNQSSLISAFLTQKQVATHAVCSQNSLEVSWHLNAPIRTLGH